MTTLDHELVSRQMLRGEAWKRKSKREQRERGRGDSPEAYKKRAREESGTQAISSSKTVLPNKKDPDP